MRWRRSARRVRALWSRTGVSFLRAESVARFCQELLDRWARPRARAGRPRWMSPAGSVVLLRWKRRGPGFQLVLPLHTASSTPSLVERQSERLREHLRTSSSVLRFTTSLESRQLSTLLRTSAVERVLREHRGSWPGTGPARAALGGVVRAAVAHAPALPHGRAAGVALPVPAPRTASGLPAVVGGASVPGTVSVAAMVSIRNLFRATTVHRPPGSAAPSARAGALAPMRTPALSARLRSTYATVHSERLVRTPAAVPARESERHALRPLPVAGQAFSGYGPATRAPVLAALPTPHRPVVPLLAPGRTASGHRRTVAERPATPVPTQPARSSATLPGLPLRAASAPPSSAGRGASARSALGPALAYLRRGESAVNERTLRETVTEKVQATVERKMVEHVNTLVARALAPDSSLAQELGRAITSDLHDSLVLARERMGWR